MLEPGAAWLRVRSRFRLIQWSRVCRLRSTFAMARSARYPTVAPTIICRSCVRRHDQLDPHDLRSSACVRRRLDLRLPVLHWRSATKHVDDRARKACLSRCPDQLTEPRSASYDALLILLQRVPELSAAIGSDGTLRTPMHFTAALRGDHRTATHMHLRYARVNTMFASRDHAPRLRARLTSSY